MNLLLAASALALVAAQNSQHGHSPQLGKVSFETSCSADANGRFQDGLAWLHSFEYEQAAAMSYYHPLWAPPSATELEKGKSALARAHVAGAKSAREQAYIAALETFYRNTDRVDHKHRALAYSGAMEQLHKQYPQDREAAIFYALSLIAAGTMDKDQGFAREKEEGSGRHP